MNFFKIFILLIALFLGGCSVYKSEFDCKGGKGVGCESVSKVNELVDSNYLDDFIEGDLGGESFNRQQAKSFKIHFYEGSKGWSHAEVKL